MADNSERLQLIQRAAKRLLSQTSARVPEERGAEADSARDSPADLLMPPRSEQNTSRAGPLSQHDRAFANVEGVKPAPCHPARLNFAQLRRLGVMSLDNMTHAVSYDCRAIKRKLLANARESEKNPALTNNLVMVTSALPGEGKTFTAVNLALTLAAEPDLQVLLVDGDVVNPTLNGLFDRKGDLGLTDLLNGRCKDVSEALYRCEDLPNLRVIFSGNRDKTTPELLASQRMASICREISKRYDNRIIIIDTPPVLACAEPASIAMHVHHVILVVAASHGTRSQVRAALESVSACRSVSILLNKTPEWYKVAGEGYYYDEAQNIAAQ